MLNISAFGHSDRWQAYPTSPLISGVALFTEFYYAIYNYISCMS